MLTSSLLITAAGIPAVLVATGVIGALGSRRQLNATSHAIMSRVPTPDAIPMLIPEQEPQSVFEAEDDSTRAAMLILDEWSARPRSEWHAIGARMLSTSRVDAGAVTASQLILEGVLAHHDLTLEAWMVRDAADTAWHLAAQDDAPTSTAIELAARRSVTNAALAMLARGWLPIEDFERLSARIAL